MSYPRHSLQTLGVFYSPSWLGFRKDLLAFLNSAFIVYIYICVCVCVCVCERERERESERELLNRTNKYCSYSILRKFSQGRIRYIVEHYYKMLLEYILPSLVFIKNVVVLSFEEKKLSWMCLWMLYLLLISKLTFPPRNMTLWVSLKTHSLMFVKRSFKGHGSPIWMVLIVAV